MRIGITLPGSILTHRETHMFISAALAVLGGGLLSVVGWAFTLNSRVAVLEANKASLEKLVETQLEAINQRLARIERKLDGDL